MKKVAVFGKPGGGKSTLSKTLSVATGIELCPLDLIEYSQGGERVSAQAYADSHAKLIAQDRWIIEGLGTLRSFWLRVDAADTLIYIDLPYHVHYWWVTKRLLKSCFIQPEGWPEGSSVLKGTLASWKYLRLSPKFWTTELFSEIELRAKGKVIHRVTTVKQLNDLVANIS
ncbi:adenylate kinase [Arenicella xantha]|uniref:Adenylate kinase family enzyme n=1 Tax=Arenicella xantha TaxID=644221 RepID=A0A395JGF5_9GAMM|nr:adenylate kinase family enzyme [Arenicella xantha]